ncbi:MAG: hypothetical protein KDK60_02550 [Chlamydiia bacterium]|nr:hypothetical protein [Chlamydiia bacterium]
MKRIILPLLALISIVVEAANWEPTMVVSTGIETGDATLVCDDFGNAAIIWRETDGNIYSSYRPVNGVWETPTNFGPGNNSPHICVDEGGNLTAIWITDFSRDVVSAYRPFGGSWQPIVVIDGFGEARTSPRVSCVGNSTYSMATWLEVGFPEPILEGAFRTGLVWSVVDEITDNTFFSANSFIPVPKILPNGTARIVANLEDISTGITDIYVITRSLGGTYSAPMPLGFTGGPFGTDPSLFDFELNSLDQGVVGVLAGNGSIGGTILNGGTWSPAGIITSTMSTAVEVAIDEQSRARAIWSTAAGTIEVGTTPLTPISWSIETLSTGGGNTIPRIDASSNGAVVASWISGASEVLAKVGFNGTFEPTPTNLGSSTSNQDVCVSNGGITYATWINSGTGFVDASRTIDVSGNILRLLGKKRLIYQKGLYP